MSKEVARLHSSKTRAAIALRRSAVASGAASNMVVPAWGAADDRPPEFSVFRASVILADCRAG